jgi:hypothetical protein
LTIFNLILKNPLSPGEKVIEYVLSVFLFAALHMSVPSGPVVIQLGTCVVGAGQVHLPTISPAGFTVGGTRDGRQEKPRPK